ncbi:MAG: TolB family protein [Actinomycetota bacterium]
MQLTDNTRAEDDPDWSPDGTRIVFNQFDFDGSLQINNELWIVGADGTGLDLLHDQHDAFQPTFSPDGTKVAFMQDNDIVRIPSDGGTLTTIVGGTAYDYDPDWGPVPTEPTTGELIAFTSGRDGNAEIYVMGPNGANQTRLTNNGAMDDYAAISPDGTQIAFTSWRDGDAEIYLMGTDGSDVTQITTNTGYDAEPTWSPDGEAIMYVSDRSGSSQLWFTLLDPPTTFGPYAPGGTVSNFSPDWSEQGVAYVSDEDGDNDLYSFIPEGTVTNQLTDDPASDYGPNWSHAPADAIHHHVLFVRGAPGEGDIWDLTLELSSEAQVTETPNLWESSPSFRWDSTYFAFARATLGDLSTAQIWSKDMEGQLHQLTTVSGGNYNPDWGPCALDAGGLCGVVPAPPVKHARTVTLDLADGNVASGKVTCPDDVEGCVAGVPVKIQRKTQSGWDTVRTVDTNLNGKYEEDLPNVEGKYRAVAKKVRLTGEVCLKAISDGVKYVV